jgi:hypothetical protein
MELFMVRFGIQAPHEQINPTDLLNDVILMIDTASRSAGQVIIICLGGTLGPHAAPLGCGLGQRLPKQTG